MKSGPVVDRAALAWGRLVPVVRQDFALVRRQRVPPGGRRDGRGDHADAGVTEADVDPARVRALRPGRVARPALARLDLEDGIRADLARPGPVVLRRVPDRAGAVAV